MAANEQFWRAATICTKGCAERTRSAEGGATRNWLPVGVVVLNPQRASDQTAASPMRQLS
jgi:hypothetical protein